MLMSPAAPYFAPAWRRGKMRAQTWPSISSSLTRSLLAQVRHAWGEIAGFDAGF